MGAFGYSLFDNDHDHDFASDFSVEAGLDKLEKEDIKAAKAGGKKVRGRYDTKPPKKNEVEIHYSVYGPDCSDIERVRKHMDSGVLDNLLAKIAASAGTASPMDIPEPDYAGVLLCACAMTLGCKLRSNVREKLKELVPNIFRLPPDADEQLERALIGPDIYKSGEPYTFTSPGPYQMYEDSLPEESGSSAFTMLNVTSQYGFGVMPKRLTKRQVDDKMLVARGAFGPDRCASCGMADPADDTPPMVCGKCKLSHYCDRDCQKVHWVLHKKVCKVAEMKEDVVMGETQRKA